MERGAEGLAFALGLERAQLWFADFVADEVEGDFFVVARDRENLLENRLQTGFLALGQRDILLQKLDVGIELHLDEIGRFRSFLQFTEIDSL